MELVKSIKKLLQWKDNLMKFNIYNKTAKRQEDGVVADNPQMLKQLYAMCGEEIDILSVANETVENILGPITVPDEIKKLAASLPDDGKQIVKPILSPGQTGLPGIQALNNNDNIVDIQAGIGIIPERYFTDNGIEYKIDSHGSYKKSWVDVDPKLFRVINSENNKEVKMTNKKIQTLDWVKID